MSHDVAPMTCRVFDAEEVGPVFGFCQRLIPPRIPINGVMGVLEQIVRDVSCAKIILYGGLTFVLEWL
jgi:hypothetical protein